MNTDKLVKIERILGMGWAPPGTAVSSIDLVSSRLFAACHDALNLPEARAILDLGGLYVEDLYGLALDISSTSLAVGEGVERSVFLAVYPCLVRFYADLPSLTGAAVGGAASLTEAGVILALRLSTQRRRYTDSDGNNRVDVVCHVEAL